MVKGLFRPLAQPFLDAHEMLRGGKFYVSLSQYYRLTLGISGFDRVGACPLSPPKPSAPLGGVCLFGTSTPGYS